MRSRTLLLALAATSFSLPATVVANEPITRAPIARDGEVTDSARIRATMLKADALFESGRIKEARTLYRTLANEQSAEEQYAGAVLWRLAETYFAGDDARGAARALDAVAEAAGRFGDPALELKATFEAALVYQELKDRSAVALRLPRIKTLLQSPVVPQEQKQEIKGRMSA